MKVLIKGGVWKNTEDEILKAAVMKYGKNQWARISSLLTRKTPKQCKARWFEWIDPSIKKTEWSKEEDEKLLHLAKLMPTQWRTIAPIVGRTAAQCLERYQKLLDEAEAETVLGDVGPSSDDIRKLRPGEIDPDPETKPARPDPVDMDEDEKEMLSEARARLANTMGKKAKRKAREKQLEGVRRITQIQKRRELKAAGLDSKIEHYQKGVTVDYNADIPFYKPQPAGFYDINDEIQKEKANKIDLTNVLLSQLDGKRKIEIEMDERKKDAKKAKFRKDKGEFVTPDAVNEDHVFTARKKLVLPQPQVSEAELQEIVKLGSAAKAIGEEEGSFVDYNARGPTPLRTPRAAASVDTIHQQARNLRAMTESQTPLLGDVVNVSEHLTFGGATPLKSTTATPNPLAAHLTPRVGMANGPSGPSFGRTPLRDQMGINTDRGFEETPRNEKVNISSLFASLPKPSNDFDIILPEPAIEFAVQNGPTMILDAEDVLATNETKRQREEQDRRSRLSQAVQKQLPRPIVYQPMLDSPFFDLSDPVSILIAQEKLRLLVFDAINHPEPAQERLIKPKNALFEPNPCDPSLDLALASRLVLEESSLNDKSFDDFLKAELAVKSSMTMIFTKQGGKLMNNADMTDSIKNESFKIQLSQLKESMKEKATKAASIEKKAAIKLGGYIARSKVLKQEFDAVFAERESALLELSTFENLSRAEEINVQSRIWRARKDVERLAMMEDDLQAGYRTRMRQLEELKSKIQ